MKASRFINILFSFLFLATGVFAAAYLYRDYQHLDTLKTENRLLETQHASLAVESAKKRSEISRLNDDPEHVESVIRTKLRFAKEGELIFRFEQ